MVRGLQPDLVVLGVGRSPGPALDVVRSIREELPHTGVVLLSGNGSPELILRAMRAGAHEFLPLPLERDDLSAAVERLQTMLVQMMQIPRHRGRTLAVCPAKGGVGGSTLATNLALSLIAAHPTKRIALVDFERPGGDLAFMLGLEVREYAAQAMAKHPLDEDFVRERVTSHRTGVRVLTMFEQPEDVALLSADAVPELVGVLNELYDYVVVDAGRSPGARTMELMDLADELYLVTTLDAMTLLNARKMLERFDRLELGRDRVRIVVNRHQDERVTNEDVESACGTEVFWSLPNDYRPVRHALDSREPVVLDSPGSRLAGSYRGLASTIAEQHAASDFLRTQERARRVHGSPPD